VVDTVHGCRLQDSIQIVNVPCKHNIILPNIFTPNDDGVNDLFNVINLCPGDEVNMEIFNRWGESIQQYILTKEGWDGHTKSGNLAPEGEYFYVVEVNKKTYKGVVQLVRGK